MANEPNVKTLLLNGTLGSLLALVDGTAGQVITGVSNGDITVSTPFLVVSFEDAVSKGLANDTNPFAYKYVKEFYDEAPSGTELYLMLVPDTMTVDMMADKTNPNGAVKLLDFADGKIRLLGVMDDPASITTSNGLDENVYTAKTNMQALAIAYAADDKQSPFWGFVGGTGFTGVATDLDDQTQSSDNYVSIVIGDTVTGGGSMLGIAMGRAASIPVQRKISRVKDGKLNITACYLGSDLVENYNNWAMLHDKGYISPRKFVRREGYFFARDYTCTSTTDDYSFGARRRIANKMQIIAYEALVEEIEDEVPTDEDGSGKIDAAYAAYLEAGLGNQYRLIMVANKELTDVTVSCDRNQNVISTNKTVVVVKGTPVGYNGTIEVPISFYNPSLNN